MAKTGRRGKYEYWISEDGLFKLRGWAKRGLLDYEIAKNIGISLSTFYEWKNKYTEFSEAVKENKEVMDIIAENSMRKLIEGYDYEETKVILGADKKPIRIERVKKHVKPDATMIQFYLPTRMPDVYRTVQRLEHSGQVAQVDETTKGLAETDEGKQLLRQLFELKSKQGMG